MHVCKSFRRITRNSAVADKPRRTVAIRIRLMMMMMMTMPRHRVTFGPTLKRSGSQTVGGRVPRPLNIPRLGSSQPSVETRVSFNNR